MSVLLGFDFGPRKIGLAVGQLITRSATPLTTLRSRNQQPDWAGITALITDWQPTGLVVGLPFNMDDTEVAWAPQVHRFSRQLQGRYRLPVYLVDERLTSLEARQQLSARSGRHAPSREAVDALAAALILETWLRDQP